MTTICLHERYGNEAIRFDAPAVSKRQRLPPRTAQFSSATASERSHRWTPIHTIP
jgi:hypothetical protein